MAYDDTLIVDHIKQTHGTELLSEREKHLIGLAVTMTRGCQVCTRNRIEKARGIGLSDDELNALVAVNRDALASLCHRTCKANADRRQENQKTTCRPGGAASNSYR